MRSIRDSLMKLSIRDLTDIGFRLLVDPPANRGRREAWCAPLEEVLTSDPGEIYPCLSLYEWQALRDHIQSQRKGGSMLDVSVTKANIDMPLRSALQQLRQLGLCCRDKQGWHIQPYVGGIIPQGEVVWDELARHEEDMTVMLGYLRIYGMLPIQQLMDWMIPEELPRDELDKRRDELLSLYRRRWGLAGVMIGEETLWLVCPDVEDPDGLYSMLRTPDAQQMDYAAFTHDEAAWCGGDGIPGRAADYAGALSVYARHDVPYEIALDTLDHALTLCQQHKMSDAMNVLAEPMEFPPTPSDLHKLSEAFMRVPQWHLKGRSLRDMEGGTVVKEPEKRVKQNDICPCGSGRLFKNCCGRFQ